MTISQSWDIQAVAVNCIGMGAPVTLGQTVEYPLDANMSLVGPITAGQVFPRCVYIEGAQPQAALQTTDLETAIAAFGLFGFGILTDGSHAGVTLYGQQHQFGGMRRTGSVHKAFTIVSGMVYPRRLEADASGSRIYYDIVSTKASGITSEPVVVTNGVALPALPSTESYWRLGQCTIANTTPENIERVSIDFNIRPRIKRDNSDIYGSFISIEECAPTISFSGGNLDLWNNSGTFSLAGSAGTQANTYIQLRKVQCGGRFIADGTPGHIKLSAAGIIVPQQGLAGREAGASLMMKVSYDGINSPITALTGTTYSPTG